jgi:hypothetical protein
VGAETVKIDPFSKVHVGLVDSSAKIGLQAFTISYPTLHALVVGAACLIFEVPQSQQLAVG